MPNPKKAAQIAKKGIKLANKGITKIGKKLGLGTDPKKRAEKMAWLVRRKMARADFRLETIDPRTRKRPTLKRINLELQGLKKFHERLPSGERVPLSKSILEEELLRRALAHETKRTVGKSRLFSASAKRKAVSVVNRTDTQELKESLRRSSRPSRIARAYRSAQIRKRIPD